MNRTLVAAILVLTACSKPIGSGGGAASCTVTGCQAGYTCNVSTGVCVADGGTGCIVTGYCPAGYTCNATSGICVPDVACVQADCPSGTWCDKYTEQCSSAPYCTDATDCPPAWSCNGSHQCEDPLAVSCVDLRDCPVGRLCEPSIDKCVQAITCSTSYPCPYGAECVSGLCARLPAGECIRQGDCFTAGDRCVSGLCVGCATTGAVCTGALEACDPATNTCRACTSTAECPAGLVCTPDGCAECASNADCAPYPNRPTCVLKTYEGDAPRAGRCQECADGAGNTCGASAGCATYGQFCSPWGSCASDADCSGATPRCAAVSEGNSYCGRCAVDAHCPAGQGCRWGECHVFPPGDRCQEPIPLALASPRTDLAVSLAGFGWEDPTEWGSYDAYFRFTLTEPTRLVIDGRSAGAWFDGSLRLYSDGCAGLVGRHTIGVLSYNPPYSIYYPAWTVYLPAGTWVLALEGAAKPEYVLSIEKTPATLAAGQACCEPDPHRPEPHGLERHRLDRRPPGHLRRRVQSQRLGLDGAHGRLLARPRGAVLRLAHGDAARRGAQPRPRREGRLRRDRAQDVQLHRGPGGDADVRADAGRSPLRRRGRAEEHQRPVSARRDGRPVVGERPVRGRGAARPLRRDGAGDGTVGPNTSTPSAPSASCGVLGGNDVFYRFTTVADQRLDVQVIGDGTWRPGVSVRPACDAASGAVCALALGGAAAVAATVDILPPGEWIVQVAASTSLYGSPFTLQVALSAPNYPVQTNDTCATATVLTEGYPVNGDTRGVSDDASGACGAEATGSGKDLAYSFTAPSRGAYRATVSVSPTTPGFKPVVRARADCGASTELTCDVAAAAGQGAWLPSVYLEGGASVVTWVDGADGTAGAFSLYPIFYPAPANDLCTGATVIGSTWNAIDLNVPGSVATAFTDGTCAGAAGPDVFFKMLVPSGRHDVMVTVDPSSYFQPAVAYYGGSCGAACAASAVAPAPGANAVLASVSLNGSGYFGVSSVDGGRGDFSLIVTFLP